MRALKRLWKALIEVLDVAFFWVPSGAQKGALTGESKGGVAPLGKKRSRRDGEVDFGTKHTPGDSAVLSCLYPRRGALKVCQDEGGKRGLDSGFFSQAGGESGSKRDSFASGWSVVRSNWLERRIWWASVGWKFGKESW